MKILITGANGFIGRTLVLRLISESANEVIAATRSIGLSNIPGVQDYCVGDLSSVIDWSLPLQGVDTVVHCAARVHVVSDSKSGQLEAYLRINTEGTLNLARQAVLAGVKRFVFISSIKVNGEATQIGSPYHADDQPAPIDPYGISKLEAEKGLRKIEALTGMGVVIVRPPLVYGPGVKANFASMMGWLKSGFPLPFGMIHNARSIVALENLVDLLVTCVNHPAAPGQTFLVSDGEDVSTTELLQRTAQAMGKKAFLLPIPTFVLKVCAAILGKRDLERRLCGFLQVDIEKTRSLLGWNPPLKMEEGLKNAVEGMKH